MAQDRTMENLGFVSAGCRDLRPPRWRARLLSVVLVLGAVAALGGVCTARQLAWERECERLVPAWDHNAMDVCTSYGPGALDRD